MSTTNGIILAGGRGTRLGPLTAQISKALVSVGQRPHIVHQLLHLKDQGVEETVVVVSPETEQQVSNVIARAGLLSTMRIMLVTQSKPTGPVAALSLALSSLTNRKRPTFLLMGDTVTRTTFPQEQTWVGVAAAPKQRSFCYYDEDTKRWVDDEVAVGQVVSVGVYRFANTYAAARAAAVALAVNQDEYVEVPMSEFLNALGAWQRETVDDWQDIGDVMSLASSHRRNFIVRDHHGISLDDDGVLTKTGTGKQFVAQAEWLRKRATSARPETQSLFPNVYSAGPSGIKMDYIDTPTLAELWLYWPGRPDMWSEILQHVIDRIDRGLWMTGPKLSPKPARAVADIFVQRAVQRLMNDPRADITEFIHEIEKAGEKITKLLPGGQDQMVLAHGDLCFSNILYAINSGTVKLIDPRGDEHLPLIYEFAKLRYSYHGGISAVMNGLVSSTGRILPDRHAETAVMDLVIQKYYPTPLLQLVEALLMLAGSALHNDREAKQMRLRGGQMLNQALSWYA